MLQSLRASIEKKKRDREATSVAASSQSSARKEPVKSAKDELPEDEIVRIQNALNEKAKRYKQIEEGISTVVPAGALVDFERKTDRVLVHEEELTELRREDRDRQLGAAIPPPPDLYVSDGRKPTRSAVNAAVDDILSSLAQEHCQEETE